MYARSSSGSFGNPLTCFSRFQDAQAGAMSIREFTVFLGLLFTDFGTTDPPVGNDTLTGLLFKIFDRNRDDKLEYSEFEDMWDQWAVSVLHPRSAFIVVDVQNDFISGALSLKNDSTGQDPERIIPVINNLTEKVPFDVVVYTFDWHPGNHISFVENKHLRSIHESSRVSAQDAKVLDTVLFVDKNAEHGYMEQTLWPSHAVQDSWGAELHRDLKIVEDSLKLYKGTHPDVDSYSAFWDNERRSASRLNCELRERNITAVFVCGLAYDVCVGSTALHATELGYATVLIEDASCGTSGEAVERMRETLHENFCLTVRSSEVADLVSGRIRPWRLGVHLATAIAKNNS